MCGRLKNFVNLTEVKSKTEDAMNIEEFREYCLSLPGVTAELRARYEGVRPAWHMNKRMWSDVYFGSDVSDALVCRLVENSYRLVENSYRLVRDSLPAKERETL